MCIGICIDSCLRKLSCADFVREQNVKFLIRSALRLWHTEIGPKPGKETCARPEEARLALPVALGRVQHVRSNSSHEKAHKVVSDTCQTDALITELDSRCLTDDGICHRTQASVIEKQPGEDQARLRVAAGHVIYCRGKNADEEHESEQQEEAPDEQGSTPHPSEQEPRNESANTSQTECPN